MVRVANQSVFAEFQQSASIQSYFKASLVLILMSNYFMFVHVS